MKCRIRPFNEIRLQEILPNHFTSAESRWKVMCEKDINILNSEIILDSMTQFSSAR